MAPNMKIIPNRKTTPKIKTASKMKTAPKKIQNVTNLWQSPCEQKGEKK